MELPEPVDVIVWTGTLALSGATPLLLAVIWYWNAGALEIFLWAMFGSNGARWDQFVDPAVSTRLVNMLVVVAPPAMFASWSFILGRSSPAFQRYRTLIAVWLITGFMTLTAALSYGELSAMFPKAGGQYVYLKEAFNPLAGFLYGWSFFMVIQTASIAAVGVAF